jgi:hypothetical protein
MEVHSRGGAALHEMLTKRPRKEIPIFAETEAAAVAAAAEGGEGGAEGAGGAAAEPPLPADEVKSRLRSMRQPVTYFGETAWERYERMRKVESEGASDEFAVSGGFATRNVFLQQDSRGEGGDDDDDDDEDDEDDEGSSGGGTPRKSKTIRDAAGGGDGGGGGGGGAGAGGGGSGTADGGGTVAKEVDDHKKVREYFKGVLRAWEETLNAR